MSCLYTIFYDVIHYAAFQQHHSPSVHLTKWESYMHHNNAYLSQLKHKQPMRGVSEQKSETKIS